MTPSFSYTVKGNYDAGFVAAVRDFNGVVLHQTATHAYRSDAAAETANFANNLYATIPATFRLVKKVMTGIPDGIGGTYYRVEYVADVTGDWVEKDYGNGCRSYRMAADCAKATAKLRDAA